MPSRRSLLRTVSVAAGGVLAGCSALNRGADGYVQLKSIEARDGTDRQPVEQSVLRVTLGSPPGTEPPELTHLSAEWADRFDTPHDPVVPDALHDDLTRAYDTVRYVVGVCSPAWAGDEGSEGCYNVATNRETFNSVQVHDRVSASSDGSYLAVHSVDGSWTFGSGTAGAGQ